MIHRLLLVVLMSLAVDARAQTPSAPPRAVADILAVLDQYKPDPAAVEKLRAIADSQPPAINPAEASFRARHELAVFYHQRSRANFELGRSRQRLSDLKRALEYVWDGEIQRERLSIGSRARILDELMQTEWSSGNRLRSMDYAEQFTRYRDGWLLVGWAWLAGIYSGLGNIAAATDAARKADEALVYLRQFPSYRYYQYSWKAMAESSRGAVLEAQGNFGEAERQLRASLENRETAYQTIRDLQGAYAEASPDSMYLSSWASVERNLARILRHQGRIAEAEYHARSALLRQLQGFGRYSINSAGSITALGWVVLESGRFADAAALAQAAIDSAEQAGVAPESSELALARSLLGAALVAQSRWPEAIAVFERRDKGLASDPEQYAMYPGRDSNWGMALLKTGKASQSLEMLEAIYRKRLSSGLTDSEYFTAQARGFYAMALAASGQSEKAVAEFRGAVPVLLEEARRGAGAEQGGSVKRQMHLVWILEAYMKLLVDERESPLLKNAGIDAVAEAFRLADVSRGSSVQRALSESAARAAASDPALAVIARREQDVQQRFVTLSDLRNRLLSRPPAEQLPKITADLKRDIEALRGERDKLRLELEKNFPAYANLIAPKAPTMAAARLALREGEALIATYHAEDATYLWAMRREGGVAFAKVPLARPDLQGRIGKLLEGVKVTSVYADALPRFDVMLGHELYKLLLEPVASGWKGAKSLLVVPHGPAAMLPFAVLPTAAMDSAVKEALLFAEYRKVPWLLREAALTQFPSANALVTLRAQPPARPGRLPFAGFGDPIFNPKQAATQPRIDFASRGVAMSVRSAPQISALASARLANLPRLPDTAEEIRAIARTLGVPEDEGVFLDRRANEKEVKSQSLANRRIIAFATHGLVAGDLDGLTQPALALTSPEVASIDDDGLLTMEEVLSLKLDADWVILSACNTAAGDGAGAEAVSGLGRAFFYAGSRSLLVSNWSVETVSARKLTTSTIERYTKDGTRRAEALRQATLELLDRGEATGADGKPLYAYAHPLFWAPFSVIGDGN